MSTLADLLRWRVATSPGQAAYRQFDAQQQQWRLWTWAGAGERIAEWSAALAASGVARGGRVAVLLPNGLDAVCIDQAALANACVPVPLHAIDNPASIAYILSDSEASLLVVAREAQWQAIAAVGVALPALKAVVCVEELPEPASLDASRAGPQPIGVADWLAAGRGAATGAPPQEQDLAAIVYTSGTTGKPKGVMLTHRNVLSNVKAVLERIAPQADDVFLSFLPLSHTFERTAGYYVPMAAGACVGYARSVAQLAEDLKIVRPTVLVSVPRIYERVYAKLQERLGASPLQRRLFDAAQAVGWRRFCRTHGLSAGGAASPWDALAWPLLDRLVGRTLRAQFGGRLRVAVSGGAPLSQAIAHCFLGLGVPIVQGYGMTETSPVVSCNTPDDNDPATVGRPLSGVEVRIGDNRELQVRAPSVMRGYWKRDGDTARAFVDGDWLRTGDQAAIENGRVRILGRVKEIIVTSTGEKIAPADLELAIGADPLFEQVYAFGDNRPFIACIAVVNEAEWARLANSLGLPPTTDALQSNAAREAALARIRELTLGFPHYAQPRAVALTTEPWTIENGLMTPTLKLKRQPLAARFASEIEALYRR